ncbi:hypothetical protein, partial [Candidatus Kuenenia stuttgartiensis]|uniref:hypothetical protein n=1 Tax=Kuenenia stuttgartiensis TaxID=174633 RepID=UPI001B8C14D5
KSPYSEKKKEKGLNKDRFMEKRKMIFGAHCYNQIALPSFFKRWPLVSAKKNGRKWVLIR